MKKEKIICPSCGYDSDGYASYLPECPHCGEPNPYPNLIPHHRIVNLTPHKVTYWERIDAQDHPHVVEEYPSEGIARCQENVNQIGVYYDAYAYDSKSATPPIYETSYGDIEGLPDPMPGVLFIVSRLVKQAVPYRDDCVVPCEILRDTHGHVIGCMGFSL
jgi:hypothetical protein